MEFSKKRKIFKIMFYSLLVIFTVLSTYFLTSDHIISGLYGYKRTLFMIVNSLIGDISVLLIFIGLTNLIFKKDKGRYVFLLILFGLMSLVYFAMSVYIKYFGMLFTFYSLGNFGGSPAGDAFEFVLEALPSLIMTSEPIFFLPLIILIIVYCFYTIFVVRKYKKEVKEIKYTNRITKSLLIIFVGIITLVSSFGFYNLNVKNTWNEYNASTLYKIEGQGMFSYYIRSAYEKMFDVNIKYDDNTELEIAQSVEELKNEDMNDIFENSVVKNSSIYNGICENKNLLLIQMESINNFLIGLKVNVNGEYVEVTPNLNKLSEDGIYFDKFYTSVGIGNTSDAEFSAMTGLYPDGERYTIYEYNKDNYQSLAKLFNDKGYDTFSFHANEKEFYKRAEIHTQCYGFDRHYSKEDFIIDENQIVQHWLGDESFLKQTVDVMKNSSSTNTPVFAFAVTISNHTPFSEPITAISDDKWFSGKDNLLPSSLVLSDTEYKNEIYKGYLEYASYTDYAIGEALKYLEENKMMENTIIAMYGDHGIDQSIYDMFYEHPEKFSNEKNEFITNTSGRLQSLKEREFLDNIPFIIYDPSASIDELKSKTISLTRDNTSIQRTFSNMFNLNSEYYIGVDALSDVKTIAYSPRNGNIYANGIILSSINEKYVITNSNYSNYYTSDLLEKMALKFQKTKDLNDKILRSSVFK